MKQINRLIRMQIVTAEPEKILSEILRDNVALYDITFVDQITVEASFTQNQASFLIDFLEQKGITYSIVGKTGLGWSVQKLFLRRLLILGLVCYFVLAITLPGRIYFLKVVGNEQVAAGTIMEAAKECGIRFGMKSSEIRSEQIKNQLLSRIPEIQWVGITSYGSAAIIHVEERSLAKLENSSGNGVSGIVAKCDGVVTGVEVISGNALVTEGQAVKKGDILVSGYTDCGLKVKGEQAKAEVYAYTSKNKEFTALYPGAVRVSVSNTHTCYRVRIGKKVINLCNHSGIRTASCVKMYSEDYLTLPGGFQLPVSIIRVNNAYCELNTTPTLDRDDFAWICQFAGKWVKKDMVAGKILKEEYTWANSKPLVLIGNYSCHEMIGEEKYEEII